MPPLMSQAALAQGLVMAGVVRGFCAARAKLDGERGLGQGSLVAQGVWVLMVARGSIAAEGSMAGLMAALTVQSPTGAGLTREPKPLSSSGWKVAHRSVAVRAAQVSEAQAPARVLVRVQGLVIPPLLQLQPLLNFFFFPL